MLRNLLHGFLNETTQLQVLAARTRGSSDPLSVAARCYAVVRLHDAWHRFCRQLIVASASGRATTVPGVGVSAAPLVTRLQLPPLDALKSTYKPWRQARRLWEPPWHFPAEALQAGRTLGIQNYGSVSLGLSISGSAPGDLTACRNFLAHRGKAANQDVDLVRAKLGLSSAIRVEDLVTSTLAGGGSVFDRWCLELRDKAMNATS